jgi:hypothetical protein
MSSVGYGDLVLSNMYSRCFGMAFAVLGIFGTVATAGSCAETYLKYRTTQVG